MSDPSTTHDALLALLTEAAARGAARALEAIGAGPKPKRILLSEVKAHGAPSRRWVETKAREGLVRLQGPRGGRFVDADDLAKLLTSVSIKPRAAKSHAPDESGTSLAKDAENAIANLAARRRAKAL